jgi:hypothetical protein
MNLRDFKMKLKELINKIKKDFCFFYLITQVNIILK